MMCCCPKYCRISSIFRPPDCQNPNNYDGLLETRPVNTLSRSRFFFKGCQHQMYGDKILPLKSNPIRFIFELKWRSKWLSRS